MRTVPLLEMIKSQWLSRELSDFAEIRRVGLLENKDSNQRRIAKCARAQEAPLQRQDLANNDA